MSKGTEMTNIDSLDLTVRTYNCLKREGINTLQGIAACTEDQLLEMRHLGQQGIDECKEKLAERGLRLQPARYGSAANIEVEHVAIYRWGDLAVTINGDGSATISKREFSDRELDALCQICEQIATGRRLEHERQIAEEMEGEKS